MATSLSRARWAAFGAAVAVSFGAGGGLGWSARAADSAESSFISISPCRLFDTRSTQAVGDRTSPLAIGETFLRQVRGSNGNCSIPTQATGIAYNITVPSPEASGFIAVYPSDSAVPNASAINPVAGGGTKANAGIVGLGTAGAIKLFVQTSGPLNAIFDITGYFRALPPGSGASGPEGPPGPSGPTGATGATGAAGSAGVAGATGPRGISSWDAIPSGQTVTGNVEIDGLFSAGDSVYSVSLPGRASAALADSDINFAADASAVTTDDDASCSGTPENPTAPAGKVCLYPYDISGVDSDLDGVQSGRLTNQGFSVIWFLNADGPAHLLFTWAYQAP